MSRLERHISVRHLRVVDAIAREGSLMRAAERMHMTQSAVTKALQEAETLAGAPLFKRTHRGAVATAVGKMLVGHARTVIAQLQRASRDIGAWMDGHGSVAIGALPSALGGLVPEAVARALLQAAGLRVSIVEGRQESLITLLRRGGLDLVVGRLPTGSAPVDVVQKVLGPDQARLVVRASHPLRKRTTPTLADLLAWPWILPPPDVTLRRQIDAAFQDAGLAPPVPRVESMSFLSNRALLLSADFVTAWPHHLAEAEARNGLVMQLPLTLPSTERPIGVWWRADPGLSPAAELIVQALCDVVPGSGRNSPAQ